MSLEQTARRGGSRCRSWTAIRRYGPDHSTPTCSFVHALFPDVARSHGVRVALVTPPGRLGTRGDLLRQRIVCGIERDVLPTREEADEIPAPGCPMIPNRPSKGGVARLQRIENRALRRLLLVVEGDFPVDAGKGPQVLRKDDADHGSVCASTESTAGRSRTIAVHLSPPSGDA